MKLDKRNIVWIILTVFVLLFLFFLVFQIMSKHYTIDFDVKVDKSQQLTVRLRGEECDDDHYAYGVDKIDVFNKGKKMQTIVIRNAIPEKDKSLLLNGHTQSPMKDGCSEVLDVNFDGAEDFSLMAVGHAGANVSHFYFTWNPEKQEYEYAFTLTQSSELKIGNQQLTHEVQCGGGPPWEITYEYDKNGKLQEVVRVEREFYENKYVKSYVYERIDGEMILTDEYLGYE